MSLKQKAFKIKRWKDAPPDSKSFLLAVQKDDSNALIEDNEDTYYYSGDVLEAVKELRQYCDWIRKSNNLWRWKEDETLSRIENKIDEVFVKG